MQLLATTGGVYDPKSDVVVQDELAADRRAAEAEQQRLQEQQLAARADELGHLAGAGRLDRTVESRPGDEAARDVLVQRGDYRATAVDGWLAQALADRSGHYADLAARTAAAVGSLPVRVRAHAALLAALARTGALAADGTSTIPVRPLTPVCSMTSARVHSRMPGATVQPRCASRGRTSPMARVMVERSTPNQQPNTS
ncbi:hypothetical protein OIB37_00735 [Streptomyces sp. NBC_00820]|uniref:hypothetical protein n=1 Tax=Streptomyces sp. NBC_00820 TaxID=2975842 RepID=UPI002ED3BD18|nr:hypothetical protein OIB37_00735 [Streptomyces sp. NBC_00820]